eukprot:1160232-Pelagomonas_calceolata.AAC.3
MQTALRAGAAAHRRYDRDFRDARVSRVDSHSSCLAETCSKEREKQPGTASLQAQDPDIKQQADIAYLFTRFSGTIIC